MAEPIVEQITQDIESTLKTVSRSAGDNVDLHVERMNRQTGNVPRDGLIVIRQGSPARDDANESQGMMWWLQPYELEYFVIQSEDSALPIDRQINLAWADIVKKLLADYTRGGLAQDTLIEPPQLWDSANGEMSGVTVRVNVQYAHTFENPYTQ